MSYNHITDQAGPATPLARLMAGPFAQAERCEACRLELEDCDRDIPGACMKCASCGGRDSECAVDCGEADHLDGCLFPSEPCGCKKIAAEHAANAADAIAEEGLDAHREERHS